MSEQKKTRNSNVELLRVLTMLFIVMGHFNGQAGFNYFSMSPNSILITILGSGSRIGVNIFLIIGVWFMVDAKFSGNRIISIWSQVVFYTYILTTLMIILQVPVSMKNIFRGYFPFIGRGLWFASAYITLMLVAPFLNKVLSWKIEQKRLLLIITFAAICLVSTLPDIQEAYLCDSLWFWFVYLGIGYYKKEIFEKHRNSVEKSKWPSLVVGVILYIGLCIALHVGTLYRESGGLFGIIYNLAYQYISDIKTLPNFFAHF